MRVSFLYPRRPVDHHGQRRVWHGLHNRTQQKPLPISGHGIIWSGQKAAGAEFEERRRRARFETRPTLDLRRHQLPVQSVVEQLFPVSPPMRSAPTTVRDNLLAAALWKALDIDLIPPRLIRVICYPLPIWREGRCKFIGLRMKNRERRDRPRGRRYR